MDIVYEVHNGKIATGALDGDKMYVYSGGHSSKTYVYEGSEMNVYDGGSADYTYVYEGGEMNVYSGGSAFKTSVYEGGDLTVYNGGTVNSTFVPESGGLYVENGGIANNTTAYLGGHIDVEEGGIANDAVIGQDGWINLCGIANATYVYKGTIYVYEGGIANDTDMHVSGWMEVSSGGIAANTVVSGGYLTVYDGGVASGTTVSSYYDKYDEEWYDGEMDVYDGGVASGTTLIGNYSDDWNTLLKVHDGGIANDTTVIGASMYVDGAANGITVNAGGCVVVWGTATGVRENGGYVYVQEDAEVTFVANTFSGVVLEGRTSATVHSGTVAVDTKVNGGDLTVYDGGVAAGTEVHGYYTYDAEYDDGEWHDGELYVYDGGVASGTVLSGYYDEDEIGGFGFMYVEEGGTAHDTTVLEHGDLYVSEGGVAKGVTVDGGYADITGAAEDVVVNQGGYVDVYGTATAVKENGGYVCAEDADEVTFVANTFSDLELIGDGASVHAGTVAKNITVRGYYDDDDDLIGQGGLDVYEGGVADCVTVDDGGKLWIDKGGKLTGSLTVSKGAEVCLQEGSIVDFDIAAVAPGSAALINNWSLVDDHGVSYTVTTSDKQKTGVYALAGGAAKFDKSITVNSAAGTKLGTVTVGGQLETKDFIYSLGIATNTLSLTVELADTEPPVKPVAKADITAKTGKNVTVTATFSDDSVVREYSLDNKAWKNYTTGIVMKDNGNVYFRAADEAGNISDVTTYKVTNIDPTMAPTGKTVSGETAADKPAATYKAELDAAGLYTVTGNFGTMKGSVTIYDGAKKVASGSIKGGVLTFKKDALLEKKSTYTVEIKNTDKKSAGAAFSWTLKAKELFTKGDNSDDTKAKAKTLAAGTPANDWVGFGDAVDYYKLGVDARGGFYDL